MKKRDPIVVALARVVFKYHGNKGKAFDRLIKLSDEELRALDRDWDSGDTWDAGLVRSELEAAAEYIRLMKRGGLELRLIKKKR